MHERIMQRLLENENPEAFLPQNLPINLLHIMLNEDTPESVLITKHAVAVLFKNRFNMLGDTKTYAQHATSNLFQSCVRKYTHFLLHEQTYRLKYTDERIHPQPTIDDIFVSSY